MDRARLARAAVVVALLTSGIPAMASPARDMCVDATNDEWAGKDADVSAIGSSPSNGSPYLGAPDPLVVVNVFSDFQCPVCRRTADPVKQLVLDYPWAVKVVFRHNALPIHPRAQAAAVAAVAAGKQGKFWQYHDRLFADQRALDDDALRQIAIDLGLDVAQWAHDAGDPKSVERVRLESAAAVRLGAASTPGIFINGIRQIGWASYRHLSRLVRAELAAAEALARSGTPRTAVPAARVRMSVRSQLGVDTSVKDVEQWVDVLLAD